MTFKLNLNWLPLSEIPVLNRSQKISMGSTREPIAVVTAADENYALPLAVTVRSTIRSLSRADRLDLYVIDGGISDASRHRLQSSWLDSRVQIHWLTPDLSPLSGLAVSGHASRTNYARLMLPHWLPARLNRVLYLDSDLLIKRPLRHLWNEDVSNVACRACQDPAAPWMDCSTMLRNYSRCAPRLAAEHPVPNFRALNIHGSAAYFNSGVMLVNLRYWREHSIAERSIECLHRNRDHVLWWDQYALNVVLYRSWQPLDIRWNQGAHIYRYPCALESPFDDATFGRLCRHPWIVHFSSHLKPWHPGDNHPYRLEFFRLLDQTSWRSWRPAGDFPSLAEQTRLAYQGYRSWYKQRVRPLEHKLKHLVGLRNRAA